MSMAPDLEMQAVNETSSVHHLEVPGVDIPESIQVDSSKANLDQDTHGPAPTTEEASPPILDIPGPQNAGIPVAAGKKTFGIKKTPMTRPPTYDPLAASYDYTFKYKDDAFGHGLDNNARVWHVYNDEAREFDADMIDEASDSLDILLVFTGLFSAVLTTFLVQTSQALSPDNAAITVSLLRELVDLQRAQATGVSVNTVARAVTLSSPSGIDKWVNGLWFTSLALSLSNALIAALAKQWLRQYHSRLTGNPKQRAILRQFRYNGFERWSVRSIIEFLPMILHVSLILFLIGLLLLLVPLNTPMVAVVGSITYTLVALYVLTTLLPLALIQCPYRTPLTKLLWRLSTDLVRQLHRRAFLSWAPTVIWRYFKEITDRYRDLNLQEAAAASSWEKPSVEITVLLYLWGHTTNVSAQRIAADSLPFIPISTVQSMADSECMHYRMLRSALAWYVCYQDNTRLLKALSQSVSPNLSDLTEAQKTDLRRTTLSRCILQECFGDKTEGYTRDFPSSFQVLASDLDLVLMTLASGKECLEFCIIGDEHSPISLNLHCEDALCWVIQHHQIVNIPELPIVAWHRLWRTGKWDPSRFDQLNRSEEVKQVVSQARELDLRHVANKARIGCGLISVEEFLKLRFTTREDLQHFGLDWIVDAAEIVSV